MPTQVICCCGSAPSRPFDPCCDILDGLPLESDSLEYIFSAHALPMLRESGGLIVGISSLAGRVGVPTRTGYAASKHAMAGFFDSLRIELMDAGVDVTMVYPGFVATGIRENATGPDGKPILVSPVKEGEVMSVEDCARRIVTAMERREREVVMTARGKIGLLLKLFAPSLIDRMAKRAIETGR